MLNYTNDLATLQTRLDDAQSALMTWETKYTQQQNHAADRSLLLGRIIMYVIYYLLN